MDTSVLIAFYSELARPELLLSLHDHGFRLYVPKAVYEEFMDDVNFKHLETHVKNGYYTILGNIPENDVYRLKLKFPSLGDGEIEVIWWGLKFENCFCVLDDKKANKSAKSMGLKVTGTIGILRILAEMGVISESEKRKLCVELIERGFRFPKEKCFE
ncbi:hypothetical protein [Ferroglobus placidus]|nr:hypothetical protein [Ferroglobus placidus]